MCVMCHGDDQGLVLPPRVAPIQVVIIPVVTKKVTRRSFSGGRGWGGVEGIGLFGLVFLRL